MIYKKQYGQPFDTESVVGSSLPMMETIPYLTKEPDGFSYAMEPQDALYGLGENVRGINKRGWVYESKCSDDGNHTEGKSSLYGAYNFMIVSGKDTFGIFIDYPGKVTFDCGYTDMDTLRITAVFLKKTKRQGWMLWVPMVFMMAVTFTALGMTIVKLSKAFVTTGLDLGNSLQLIFAVLLLILGVLVAIQGIKKLLEKPETEKKAEQV